jgi:sugar O-acyltransferase (sialic acid O-acetyltransferase NeuD family)
VIFGAGGFGREVLQVARDINAVEQRLDILGFLVDEAYCGTEPVQGMPQLGGIEWLAENPGVRVVIAVGASAERAKIAQRISDCVGNMFGTLVHPRAWLGESVEIGEGSVICAGALVTTDIRIGKHVHVNIGATIGHDAILDDFVTLNPSVNLSGRVELGRGVEVGTGSVLVPGVEVGDWSVIGAGSVVLGGLDPNVTAVGVPASVIRRRETGWHACD